MGRSNRFSETLAITPRDSYRRNVFARTQGHLELDRRSSEGFPTSNFLMGWETRSGKTGVGAKGFSWKLAPPDMGIYII